MWSNKKRFAMFFLPFLLLSQPAYAEAWCFPSGLRVALETRQDRQELGIATVVAGGASTELFGETGAAHTVEHLWFGTRQHDTTVGHTLAGIGADANAFTSHDEVVYVTVAQKATIRGLLALEAQRISDPLRDATPERIETEKAVVIAELHERYDGTRPWYLAFLSRLAPHDMGYHRGISGTPEDVAAQTEKALRSYAERAYQPANTSITVVGDFTPAQLLGLLRETFPKEHLVDPANPGTDSPVHCEDLSRRNKVAPTPMPGEHWAEIEADVDEPIAVFGWGLPAGRRWEQGTDLLASLTESQFAYRTGVRPACEAVGHTRMTTLVCTIPVGATADLAVIERTITKMNGFWRGMAEGKTFRQQRLSAVSDYRIEVLDWEDLMESERLSSSNRGYLAQLGLNFAQTNQPALRARPSHVEGIAGAGADLLTHERMRSAVLKPRSEPRPFAGERHPGRIDDPVLTRDPELTDARYLARYIVAPDTSTIRVRRHANGMTTWYWPVSGLQQPRVAAALTHPFLLEEPTLALSTFEWLKDPNSVAARAVGVESFINGRHFTKVNEGDAWLIHADNASGRWGAQALAKILIGPVLLESKRDWNTAWDVLVQNRDQSLERVETKVALARWGVFAPDLPMGLFDDDLFAQAGAVSHGEARDALRRILRPQHADLLIVGSSGSSEDLLDLSENAFSRWAPKRENARPTEAADIAAMSHPDRTVLVFAPDRPRGVADITIACHTRGTDAMSAWLLENHAEAELNSELRRKRALTYGVHAWSESTTHGPTLFLSTTVAPDRAGEAIAAIFGALAEVQDGGVAPERLAQLKVEAARSSVQRYQTGDEIMSLLLDIATASSDGEVRSLAERLAAATPESLAEEVDSCAGHEVVTVVGDPDALGAALDAAGIAWDTVP